MKCNIICLLVVCLLINVPSASAFAPENGTALRVSNDTWLYVSTATYGSADETVTVPVLAAPSWKPRISGEYLRYQVLLAGNPFAGLDTNAMVLSQAPIEGNRYVIPAGESYSFTFVALVVLPFEIPTNQKINLSLKVAQ